MTILRLSKKKKVDNNVTILILHLKYILPYCLMLWNRVKHVNYVFSVGKESVIFYFWQP